MDHQTGDGQRDSEYGTAHHRFGGAPTDMAVLNDGHLSKRPWTRRGDHTHRGNTQQPFMVNIPQHPSNVGESKAAVGGTVAWVHAQVNVPAKHDDAYHT